MKVPQVFPPSTCDTQLHQHTNSINGVHVSS